jgi:hypothetical protein
MASLGTMTNIPVREHTRQRLIAASVESNRDYDELILSALDQLAWKPLTACDEVHYSRTGQPVLCRRRTQPHPGKLHVWWDSHESGSREEWP